MREQLNALHAKLFLMNLDIKIYPNKESYKMTPEMLRKSQNREYFKRMKKLNKKFARMMALKKAEAPKKLILDAVLNLSSVPLSANEINVLTRGFKFRPTLYLEDLPIKEIIVATESMIKTANISSDTATKIRNTTIKEIGRM